ncbi:hypothetical protein [Arthrobacter sp. TMN-50]
MRRYEICLEGQLDSRWSDWFEGFTLTNGADGLTTLTGPVIDQAGLHGLLRRVGNLGMTLISINISDDADARPPAHLTTEQNAP